MQTDQFNRKRIKLQRWQRFFPTTLLTIIAIVQIILTCAIIGLELWSMIINVKYSFFFIGFIASFFYIITWISTFIVVCCCRKSVGCATFVLLEHIFSIAASSVLLFYDIVFLRDPHTCLWPNDLCTDERLNLYFFGIILSTSIDIPGLKFTLIKIQITCVAIMIVSCVIYMVIYIYINIRARSKKQVAPITIIELGRTQSPPPPYWPEPPKELPSSSEF